MTTNARRSWDRPFIRFLVVGGVNTLVTGAIVALLSLLIPGWIAFTIAFVLGLAFSVLMTGRWVFEAETTRRRTWMFTIAYSLIYVCGLALVQLMGYLGAPPLLNGATVLVTAPLGFIAGKYVFGNNRKEEGA